MREQPQGLELGLGRAVSVPEPEPEPDPEPVLEQLQLQVREPVQVRVPILGWVQRQLPSPQSPAVFLAAPAPQVPWPPTWEC